MLHSGKACRTSHFYRHFLKESTVYYFKCSYAVYGGSMQQFMDSDIGKLCTPYYKRTFETSFWTPPNTFSQSTDEKVVSPRQPRRQLAQPSLTAKGSSWLQRLPNYISLHGQSVNPTPPHLVIIHPPPHLSFPSALDARNAWLGRVCLLQQVPALPTS